MGYLCSTPTVHQLQLPILCQNLTHGPHDDPSALELDSGKRHLFFSIWLAVLPPGQRAQGGPLNLAPPSLAELQRLRESQLPQASEQSCACLQDKS